MEDRSSIDVVLSGETPFCPEIREATQPRDSDRPWKLCFLRLLVAAFMLYIDELALFVWSDEMPNWCCVQL
mgnify:CR=1 FL=1